MARENNIEMEIIMEIPTEIYYYYIFPRIRSHDDAKNLTRVCKHWRLIFRDYLLADPNRINERRLGCLEDIYRAPIIWKDVQFRIKSSMRHLHILYDFPKKIKIKEFYVNMENSVLSFGILTEIRKWREWARWKIRFWGNIPVVERDLGKALFYRDTNRPKYKWEKYLKIYKLLDPYVQKVIDSVSRYQNIDWSLPERLRD